MKNTPSILAKNTPHVWVITPAKGTPRFDISYNPEYRYQNIIAGTMRVFFTGHTIHAGIEIDGDSVCVSISQKEMSEDYQICLAVSQLIRKFGDQYGYEVFINALHCNTLTDINTRFSELGYDVTKIF